MIRRIALYTVLFFYCLANPSEAQEPAAFQITDQDGLPSMTIYQIIEDDKGYLWLGTQKGICRYDGRQFHSIQLNGFADKDILALECDPWGRIWFNNLSGQIGRVEGEKATVFTLDSLSANTLPLRFNFSDSSLYLIHPKSESSTDAIYENEIQKISFDTQGNFIGAQVIEGGKYLGSTNVRFKNFVNTLHIDMLRFKRSEHLFEVLQVKNNQLELVPFPYDDARSSIPDIWGGNSLMYIREDGTLVFYNKKNGLFYLKDRIIQRVYDFPEASINQCTEQGGKFWVMTKAGIYVSDALTSKHFVYLYPEMNVNTLHIDREGNLWIGTVGKGLYLLPNIDMSVYSSKNSGFPQDEVHSLFKSPTSQQLYIGLSNGKAVGINTDNGATQQISLTPLGRITTIAEDRYRNIWWGADDGLEVYEPRSGHSLLINSISACKVILKDHHENMLIGQATSVSKIPAFDVFSGWTGQKVIKAKAERILDRRTYGLFLDIEDRIWIGTTKGLLVDEGNGLQMFTQEEQQPFSVSSICQSSDSSIWVGTAGLGLLQIKGNTIVDTLAQQEGLASNNCTCLFIEGERLYIGTDNGLNILDLESGDLSTINDRDGLPSNEISNLTLVDDEIWLGTYGGLARFSKDYQGRNEFSPPIYLKTVRVNGAEVPLVAHQLAHWQNTLEFEFEGLAYRSRGTETYAYRLQGLGEEWNRVNDRFIRFHRLSPGEYVFEVKAINEDGVESKKAATFTFEVVSPWWQTSVFYASLVLALMSLTGGLVYWRQSDVRKRTELENHILNLQSEALRTQMNPHFIYNTLNAIQDFLITNDRTSALLYLSRFANMIRMIFDHSNQSTISLAEELEFLNLYIDLEKLRFGERVLIEMEVAPDLNRQSEMLELPPLLIQPVIENAFKHGLMHRLSQGRLMIRFDKAGQHLKCTIEDNGVGRTRAKELAIRKQNTRPKSSLDTIKERLNMGADVGSTALGSLTIEDLKDADGKASGTRVTLMIAQY